MTSIFIGGSIGSAIGSSLYTFDGWRAAAIAAGVVPLVAGIVAILWGVRTDDLSDATG